MGGVVVTMDQTSMLACYVLVYAGGTFKVVNDRLNLTTRMLELGFEELRASDRPYIRILVEDRRIIISARGATDVHGNEVPHTDPMGSLLLETEMVMPLILGLGKRVYVNLRSPLRSSAKFLRLFACVRDITIEDLHYDEYDCPFCNGRSRGCHHRIPASVAKGA